MIKWLKKFNLRMEECAGEIDYRNRSNFVLFSDGALLLSAFIFAATLILPFYHSLMLSHGFIFLYSGILFLYSRHCRQQSEIHIRRQMYLSFTPLLLGAVFLGTVFDPDKPAISIFIFLCILPLFIIDKPQRIVGCQFFFTLVFILMSRFFKPIEVYYEDLRYLPIYLVLGIGANLYSLIERVESAENYMLLRHESERDSLTELLNRKSGEEKVKVLLQAQVHGTFAIADIDDFKSINDKYGHQTGDQVLREVSQAIRSVFRTSDVIWRLGGDEFCIYAVNMTEPDTCSRRFEALGRRLSDMELPPTVRERVSVSIGCTVCLGEHMDFDEVYQTGDAALYRAKAAGRGKIILNEQGKQREISG